MDDAKEEIRARLPVEDVVGHSPAPDWPYTLYTMIHGRSEAECRGVVDDLLRSWPLKHRSLVRASYTSARATI